MLLIVSPAKPAETERIATTKNAGALTDVCSMNAAPAMAMAGYCRDTSQLGPWYEQTDSGKGRPWQMAMDVEG